MTRTTFAPLPSGILLEIDAAQFKQPESPNDDLPFLSSAGTSEFYQNYEQMYCNKINISLSSDNRDTYLKTASPSFKYDYIMYSGVKATTGSSTRGLLEDNAGDSTGHKDFKLKFWPDYDGQNPDYSGKFLSASSSNSYNVSASGVQSYKSFSYKSSRDGVAAPDNGKKIDTEFFGISGSVTKTTYATFPSTTGHVDTKIEVDGNTAGSSFFDPDPKSTSNRSPSAPTDKFKPSRPTTGGGGSGSTTSSPSSTNSPSTTRPPSTTTSPGTTSSPGTTAAPTSQVPTDDQGDSPGSPPASRVRSNPDRTDPTMPTPPTCN